MSGVERQTRRIDSAIMRQAAKMNDVNNLAANETPGKPTAAAVAAAAAREKPQRRRREGPGQRQIYREMMAKDGSGDRWRRWLATSALVGCLLLAALASWPGTKQVAYAQQVIPPPMLPSLISQLTGRAPSSETLVSDFLASEQRRAKEAAARGRPQAMAASTATASMRSMTAPVAGSAGLSLAPDVAGSIFGPTPTYSQALGGGGSFRLDQYHTIEEIYAYLDALAKRHPRRVHVFTLGRTIENRPIKALELINNATDPDFVWLDALTHAREWITGSTLLYALDKIVAAGSGGGGPISNKNFIVIPVVNPDGYAFTWSSNRMWRKNRSRAPPGAVLKGSGQEATKCIGADLNRNFDHSFGGEGSSSDPCSHIYSGAYPFSEPETRALADLMWSLRDRIKFYLTMHSFNQLWACPYAHTTEQSAHMATHMRVLRNIQQAVLQSGGVQYQIGPLSTSLYVGSGFGIDFAYDKCGIVNSYLVELRDSGAYGFVLPADQILPTARETFAGLKAGLRTVFN